MTVTLIAFGAVTCVHQSKSYKVLLSIILIVILHSNPHDTGVDDYLALPLHQVAGDFHPHRFCKRPGHHWEWREGTMSNLILFHDSGFRMRLL